MIRATVRRRGGFTLLELLVVVGLLAILAALAAGTFYRVQAGQRVGATEATQSKLQTGMDRLWRATLDEATDDVKQDKVPAVVRTLAGGDGDRTRVIWSYLRLKNTFPTSVAEAQGDLCPNPAQTDPRRGVWVWYPPVAGNPAVLVLPARKVFDRLPNAGTPAQQSAACFYLLTEISVRGERFPTEGLENQSAEIDLGSGGKARAFVDAFGEPIAFVRLGYSGETDRSPYVKPNPRTTTVAGSFEAIDALDPLGKLPVSPAATGNWTEQQLRVFWQSAAGTHWAYPGFPPAAGGYPYRVGTPNPFSPRNPMPTLVSAGPNKKFFADTSPTDLLNGTEDDAKDNILSFRLRREGNRGD